MCAVTPLIRTSPSRYARGRRCPRANHRAQARMSGPACARVHCVPSPVGADRMERARVRAGALGEAARRSGGGEAGPHVRRAHILGAISHSIRLSELSTVPTNISIPTIWMRGATPYQGNRMRHLWIACPVGTFCPFTQLILEMRTAGGACLLSTREVSLESDRGIMNARDDSRGRCSFARWASVVSVRSRGRPCRTSGTWCTRSGAWASH